MRISKKNMKKFIMLYGTFTFVGTAAITTIVNFMARSAYERNIGAKCIAKRVEESGIIPNFEECYECYGTPNSPEFFQTVTKSVDDGEFVEMTERVDNATIVDDILEAAEKLSISPAEIDIYFEQSSFPGLEKFVDVSFNEKNILKEEAYYLYKLEERGKKNVK